MQPTIVIVERTALERAVRMCEGLTTDGARGLVIVSSPQVPAAGHGDALPAVQVPVPGEWPVDLAQLLRRVEAQYIEAVLAATGG
ncbi:MAG TPA: hypothetical protein VIV57_08700, partial [Anaeromyxobacter sp.]